MGIKERHDLLHQTEYPEQNALFNRLTTSDREGRYRLVKEIVVDPHSSVFLCTRGWKSWTRSCAANCVFTLCSPGDCSRRTRSGNSILGR